jgi:toxin HigB-1
MIIRFNDAETRCIFEGQRSMVFPYEIQRAARRKLIYLDEADTLQDLVAPPGNRLERVKGDRAGQYSIRINDQWRICFHWNGKNALDVEITDYH